MRGLATKKDLLLVSIVGLLFGLAVIPVLENIDPAFWELNFKNVVLVIGGFFVFANFALWIAGLLAKKWIALWQFAKFGAGGSLSAAFDIGTLNLLSLIFQIFSGPLILVFNAISIFLATTNSYFWNKLWAFKKIEGGKIFDLREYLKFIGVILGSLIIGATIVFILTTYVSHPNISNQVWENIAKLISIPPVVAWNFIFFKYVIFKK